MAAGDFTNVRAESNSADQAIVRYTYAGAGSITLWRSTTSGGSYTQVASIPSDFGSYPTLYDGTVADATLYFFKLSDDAGLTFSSIVSVQIQKRFPLGHDKKKSALPQFPTEADVNVQNLDQLSTQIEETLTNEVLKPQQTCIVCAVNGALTLDCSDGCFAFKVQRDDITDINSISINCENLEVIFDVPEGTSTEIGGWPENGGFTGDEGFQAPVSSPVAIAVSMTPPSPCEVTRIRYPARPCTGDYTKDCYDRNTLTWTGSKFNFSLGSCGAGVASGCCSGNFTHTNSGTGTLTIFSGLGNEKPQSVGGYSIYFGRPGIGSPAWDTEALFTTVGKIQGQPIFGVCFNVPPTSTAEDFTARVIMLNYVTNLFVLGTYTGANLRTGALPTIISSAALSGTPAFFYLENYFGGSGGRFEVWNSATTPIFSVVNAGYAAASTNLLGTGFFWAGNAARGKHMGAVGYDGISYISMT